jgi:hypothetical protein
MAKLKGAYPRDRLTITIDREVLSLTRMFKEKSGLSMSSMIEELMLFGLKQKIGEEAKAQ